MTQQLCYLKTFMLSHSFVTFHGTSDFSKVILEFLEKNSPHSFKWDVFLINSISLTIFVGAVDCVPPNYYYILVPNVLVFRGALWEVPPPNEWGRRPSK